MSTATITEIDPFAALIALASTAPTAEYIAWSDAEGAKATAAQEAREAEAARIIAYREANKCRRCDGKGKLDMYYYMEGGICFACGGDGLLA